MHRLIPLTLILSPVMAQAEPLKIVTDIAPIHSLVVQLAGPQAEVSALVSGAASPHDFQFNFTQADAIQSADLVIWVGPALTPWLDEALETLAPQAPALALLETENWPELERRETFAEDDHDHDHDHGDEHAPDPHAWLDPQVAIAWLAPITDALIAADPENRATYEENAATTRAALLALDTDIASTLAPVPVAPYLVPHDAYQYFAARYGFPESGAISLSDASAPSPDQIEALRDMVRADGITCVLSDPQSREGWVDLVREGTEARTALADPMGTAFDPGPMHYDQTLRAMAAAFADCLGG